jgi:hypothetical protein
METTTPMNDLLKLQFILDRVPMTVSERGEATQALVRLQNEITRLTTEIAKLKEKPNGTN